MLTNHPDLFLRQTVTVLLEPVGQTVGSDGDEKLTQALLRTVCGRCPRAGHPNQGVARNCMRHVSLTSSPVLLAILREGPVVVVDGGLGRDLASAHPMDAALRRILDEHLALRVDLPA
jgi:hypothetical protein